MQVRFIMLYQVVLAFESMDTILMSDHSNESCWEVLSCAAVSYALRANHATFKTAIIKILPCEYAETKKTPLHEKI